jgi:hypothetical protein
MTTTIYNYKIYCNVEMIYISGWGTIPPTTCYNNNTHSVNVDSIQIINSIGSDTVTIKEDKIEISRSAKIFDIAIENVAFGETKIVNYVFPIEVSFYSFQFMPNANNTGDEFSIYANPDTVMGLITTDAIIGDTVIHVPISIMSYALIGFHLKLDDGTNVDDLGMLTIFDKINNTVTMELPTTHAFSATNTLVKMTIKIMDKAKIGGALLHKFCDDIIGGSVVPAGTIVNFIYTNNSTSGDPKSLYFFMTTLC